MAAYRALAANGRSSRARNRVVLIHPAGSELSNPLTLRGGGGMDDLASLGFSEPGLRIPTIIFLTSWQDAVDKYGAER